MFIIFIHHNLLPSLQHAYHPIAAYLISKEHTKVMRRGKENDKDELMCFDDLYLSSRTGNDVICNSRNVHLQVHILSHPILHC